MLFGPCFIGQPSPGEGFFFVRSFGGFVFGGCCSFLLQQLSKLFLEKPEAIAGEPVGPSATGGPGFHIELFPSNPCAVAMAIGGQGCCWCITVQHFAFEMAIRAGLVA